MEPIFRNEVVYAVGKESGAGVSFKNNWFIKPRYDRITKVFTEIQTQPVKAGNSVKHSTCTNYSVKGSRGIGVLQT